MMHVSRVLEENVRKNDFQIKFGKKKKLEIRREASIWEKYGQNFQKILSFYFIFNFECIENIYIPA